jgi:hypothetical protein
MLSKNSYGSFGERTEYKPKQLFSRLLFLIPKVMERLLHGFAKLLPEPSWIEGKEFFIESLDRCPFIHRKIFIESYCYNSS